MRMLTLKFTRWVLLPSEVGTEALTFCVAVKLR